MNINITNFSPVWEPRHFRPRLADMLRPLMQTLKHIVVNISIDHDDNDPLFGITSSLEDMRSKNIIESITIGVLVKKDADCHQRDYWGRFDEELTTPGWFSLKRVSLAIKIIIFRGSDDNLEVALRKLPETQCRRLSTSNSISFDFEVTPVLI